MFFQIGSLTKNYIPKTIKMYSVSKMILSKMLTLKHCYNNFKIFYRLQLVNSLIVIIVVNLKQEQFSTQTITSIMNFQDKQAMSLSNALFWGFAGLFWQSPEKVPRAPSSRIPAILWYGAGVTLVASYTANLVTFLTSK